MEIKKFIYSDKTREVLVVRETPTNILGFELSALDENYDSGLRERLRKFAPRLSEQCDPEKPNKKFIVLDEEQKPCQEIQSALGVFKNFSKSKIKEVEKEKHENNRQGNP
jgi:hypothetical protein